MYSFPAFQAKDGISMFRGNHTDRLSKDSLVIEAQKPSAKKLMHHIPPELQSTQSSPLHLEMSRTLTSETFVRPTITTTTLREHCSIAAW